MQIGKLDNYQKGYLYYVGGDGTVFRMPPRGKGGSKTKVGHFKRPEGAMCWVDGSGNVMCRHR